MEATDEIRDRCLFTRDSLDLYMNGGTAGDTARVVIEHLENCARCREELSLRLRLRALLRKAVLSEPVPPDLRSRILRCMRDCR